MKGRVRRMIDKHPTKCHICGGDVKYEKNSVIYGRQYGSGYCYRCQKCGAFVGTHAPRPREALGILADERTRNLRKTAHRLFDKLEGTRTQRYAELARLLGINKEDCHFGYMNSDELERAIQIMERKMEGKK